MSRLALSLLILSISTQLLADTFYFSSPPRLDREESDALFAPLADLLSRSSGESFVYVHPDSWFIYQSDMRKDRFQLLLDDAHFASWRIASLGHKPLAKVEPRIRYAVITTRNGRVYSTEDLVARSICAYPPPDLGTLSIIQKFDAPFRVPQILTTYDRMQRVQRLLAGECAAAILSRRYYSKSVELRGPAQRLKIITQSDSYPGLTLTSSVDMPIELANVVQRLVLSREGARATATLRDRLADGGKFTRTESSEYRGLDVLLRDYPGFNRARLEQAQGN